MSNFKNRKMPLIAVLLVLSLLANLTLAQRPGKARPTGPRVYEVPKDQDPASPPRNPGVVKSAIRVSPPPSSPGAPSRTVGWPDAPGRERRATGEMGGGGDSPATRGS